MALPPPFSAVASRAGSAVRSVGQTALVYGLIGVLALLGAGFLIAALYIWLASVTDPLSAALLMGTGFAAIAGIWLAILVGQANKREKQRRQATADAAVLASTMSLATTGLKLVSRARGPLFWPALAAIAAGIYFGRSGRDGD